MKQPRLFMVWPAYNEAENLESLIARTELVLDRLGQLGHEREYIIVDDGSTDGTPQLLARLCATLPITVITHKPNQGLGPTIRDGLRVASERADDDDLLVAMDADNTHPPGLMIAMVQKALAGNDVVIASRYRPGARVVGLQWHRKLLSLGARAAFQLTFPIPGVRDYTCGYRCYRAGIVRLAFKRYGAAFVEHSGFQCMADILVRLARLGAIVDEVPLVLRYDRKRGESKMRVARTVLQTLRLLVVRRLRP